MGGDFIEVGPARQIKTDHLVTSQRCTVRIPADQSAPPKLYLEAYTDRSSYEAGDDVSVHVSTNAARYAVEIARLGAGREMVWSREDLPGAEQPVPDDASLSVSSVNSNRVDFEPDSKLPSRDSSRKLSV